MPWTNIVFERFTIPNAQEVTTKSNRTYGGEVLGMACCHCSKLSFN